MSESLDSFIPEYRPTTTEHEQVLVERELNKFLAVHSKQIKPLMRRNHASHLTSNFSRLSEQMQGLHCSRPWLVYWTLHAADMLGLTGTLFRTCPTESIADFLFMCFRADDADGRAPEVVGSGFGGGPDQLPHLATTYAAVNALCILSRPESLSRVDRQAVARWLHSLRGRDGSFRMHTGGEIDVRATYCAASVANLLQLDDIASILPLASARYVAACQTYEGGLGCNADGGTEAHGGYTQCGVAALVLMRQPQLLDLPALRRWCAQRQHPTCLGFNGRTNKLVDSCYSHWIGSTVVMTEIATSLIKLQRCSEQDGAGGIQRLAPRDLFFLDYGQFIDATSLEVNYAELDCSVVHPPLAPAAMRPANNATLEEGAPVEGSHAKEDGATDDSDWLDVEDEDTNTIGWAAGEPEDKGSFLFSQRALLTFVMQCCQHDKGGLVDKPDCPKDAYHTCYSLSGCAVAQNLFLVPHAGSTLLEDSTKNGWLPNPHAVLHDPKDLGSQLRPTNPMFNICKERVVFALKHFSQRAFL